MTAQLHCLACGADFETAEHYACPECGGEPRRPLRPRAHPRRGKLHPELAHGRPYGTALRRVHAAVVARTRRHAGEGNTPLVRSHNIANGSACGTSISSSKALTRPARSLTGRWPRHLQGPRAGRKRSPPSLRATWATRLPPTPPTSAARPTSGCQRKRRKPSASRSRSTARSSTSCLRRRRPMAPVPISRR